MSNYADSPCSCRVDFFKPSGKWYCTEAIPMGIGMDEYEVKLIHDAFRSALSRHLEGRLNGFTAICLEPYHKHSHPISLTV